MPTIGSFFGSYVLTLGITIRKLVIYLHTSMRSVSWMVVIIVKERWSMPTVVGLNDVWMVRFPCSWQVGFGPISEAQTRRSIGFGSPMPVRVAINRGASAQNAYP